MGNSMQITIVGAGRIGTALFVMHPSATLVKRGEGIPNRSGPIFVCTRNKDLEEVIEKTPQELRSDLIFM